MKIFSGSSDLKTKFPKAQVTKKQVSLPHLQARKTNHTNSINGLLDQFGNHVQADMGMGNNQPFTSSEGPAREFWSWRTSQTFWMIPTPQQFQELNFLRRAIYLRDEIAGASLDLLAELPYGIGKMVHDDPKITRIFEECADAVGLYDFFRKLTLDYLIHGEAIPWHWWDDEKGYWGYLYSIDANDVHVATFPYSHMGEILELQPSPQIEFIMNSEEQIYRELRKHIPNILLDAFRNRKKIILNNDNCHYLMREGFSLQNAYGYQLRGFSILDRIARLFLLHDKYYEAEISIADNYIYPVNFVKLGSDSDTGFRPNQDDLDGFVSLLEQAKFDKKPWIVYQNAFEVEPYVHSANVMDVSSKFDTLNQLKMAALGVSQDMLMGDATFAGARTQLQVILMRLSTLRGKIENDWFYPKFMNEIARKNEMYKVSGGELSHGVRVKRYRRVDVVRDGRVYNERVDDRELDVAKLDWETRIHAVQDSDYIGQVKDLFDAGGVSKSTWVQSVGLDYEREVKRMKRDRELEVEYSDKVEEGGSIGGWFNKLFRKGSSEFDKISEFMRGEGEVVWKAGMEDRVLGSKESVGLYRGSVGSRRRGNLAGAVIVLDGVDCEGEEVSLEGLSWSDGLLGLVEGLFVEVDGLEGLDEEEMVDRVEFLLRDRYGEFVEFVYDEGKREGYRLCGVEDVVGYRRERGLLEEVDGRYGGTISTFDDNDVVNNIEMMLRNRLKSLPNKVKDKILEQMTENYGKSERGHLSEVMKGIDKEDKGSMGWKIKRVIRTTTVNARNLAILQALMEQKVDNFKWRRNRKSKSCDLCRARDGQVFDVLKFMKRYRGEWCRASHPNCFVNGTRVLRPDGSYTSIEDLKVGDEVLTRVGIERVVETLEREYVGQLVEINGVWSTEDHLYFDESGSEVMARDVVDVMTLGVL